MNISRNYQIYETAAWVRIQVYSPQTEYPCYCHYHRQVQQNR